HFESRENGRGFQCQRDSHGGSLLLRAPSKHPGMKPLVLLPLLCLVAAAAEPADTWRREHRTIDLHMHLDGTKGGMARAIGIMDRVGLGMGVNLSGGTVTHKDGEKSEFERVTQLADSLHPG